MLLWRAVKQSGKRVILRPICAANGLEYLAAAGGAFCSEADRRIRQWLDTPGSWLGVSRKAAAETVNFKGGAGMPPGFLAALKERFEIAAVDKVGPRARYTL